MILGVLHLPILVVHDVKRVSHAAATVGRGEGLHAARLGQLKARDVIMIDGVAVALQLLDFPVSLQFSAGSLISRRDTAADANITLLGLDERRRIDLVGLVEGADGDAINKDICALLEGILPVASLLLRVSDKIAEIGVLWLTNIRLITEALLDSFGLEFLLS